MAKPSPRLLQVKSKQYVSPHMLRVTLTGEQLAGYPVGCESANCKIILPRRGCRHTVLPTQEQINVGDKPPIRTYTVRYYRPECAEIDIDFVLHEDHGPASSWAINAKQGDMVGIAGPKDKSVAKLINHECDWMLFAGDMSALPALGANIERLGADCNGYAVIEIIDEADKQNLPFPENMEIHWVINPTPNIENSLLVDKVKQLPWLAGTASVWLAGETIAVKTLRSYCYQMGVQRSHRYASGYWQIGYTEDKHQLVKRETMKERDE